MEFSFEQKKDQPQYIYIKIEDSENWFDQHLDHHSDHFFKDNRFSEFRQLNSQRLDDEDERPGKHSDIEYYYKEPKSRHRNI